LVGSFSETLNVRLSFSGTWRKF